MRTSMLKNRLQVIDQWVEACNAHDAVGVAALDAKDARVTHPAHLQPLRGRQPFQDDTEAYSAALPDVTGELTRAVIEKDCAAVDMTIAGVNAGPLTLATETLPPTGRRVRLPVASFCRSGAQGHVVEEYRYDDTAEMLRQLEEPHLGDNRSPDLVVDRPDMDRPDMGRRGLVA